MDRSLNKFNYTPPDIRGSLYLGHFMFSWMERCWEFGFVLFLADVEPGTFVLVAVAGIAQSILKMLCFEMIGKWLDETNRLFAVHSMILLKNLPILLTLCLYFLLSENLIEEFSLDAGQVKVIRTMVLWALPLLYGLAGLGYFCWNNFYDFSQLLLFLLGLRELWLQLRRIGFHLLASQILFG